MNIETLTLTERLDFILNEVYKISNPKSHVFRKFNDFCKFITSESYVDVNYIRSILNKLMDDGYIKEIKKQDEMGGYDYIYITTFEGEYFLKISGGYSGAIASQNRHIALEKRNDKYLRYGAIFSALFAGVYLVWDVLKYVMDNYPQFPCLNCK